ncbi:MAG: hypothetical protein WDN69_15035 [Aliidongia sp.]
MAFRKGLFIVSCLTLAALPVYAQSLEARKLHAEQEAQLAAKAELTNKACGFTLKTQIDWASFNADEVLQKSVVSWCTAGLDAMEDLCGEALGKQAVAEKVKSLTCAGGSAVSATLTDGNLTYAFPFSSASNQNKLLIRSYLEKNL